jgi:hypothetical protein
MINPLRFALSIARMQENQRKSREEIHEIQETKLRELLYHARENIPATSPSRASLISKASRNCLSWKKMRCAAIQAPS